MDKLTFENIILEYEDIGSNSMQLTCYPLERGFGHTLGNLITKSIKKSSKSVAICGYFMAAVGVEITQSIIDNLSFSLREVCFEKKNGYQYNKIYKVEVADTDADMIYASDLVLPEGLSVCNPTEPIIERCYGLKHIYLTAGRGYMAAEQMQERLPEDATAIDVNFCPVDNATYKIEPIRHGSNIDKDKLTITIYSELSHTKASTVLEDTMKELQGIIEPIIKLTELAQTTQIFKPVEKVYVDEKLDLPVDEVILSLSVRAKNCFAKNNIVTFGDLLILGRNDLSKLKNMGAKTVGEITEQVIALGYDF